MKKTKYIHRLRRSKLKAKYALLIVFGFTLIGVLFASGTHSASPGRLVTFHDRGENHVILTRASSVRDALKDAHITVDPRDDVEPALNSKLLSTDSAIIIYRARPVLVIDGALREKVMTPAQSPNEIATAVGMAAIGDQDKTTITEGNIIEDGASEVLTIKRAALPTTDVPFVNKPTTYALSKAKGAQLFTDSSGVTHRETYYDLPMNVVIGACGSGDYTIRSDGVKIDKDGYVLVAADYAIYPRCTIVETSLGLGRVYDTGGFVARYPHGFDLATDWTNYNGR